MAGSGLGKIGGVLGDLWDLASSYKTDSELTRDFTRVYKTMQAIAAVEVKFIIAMFWWVGHIADALSAASVSAQAVSDDIDKIEKNELDAWTTFLNSKLPADLQAVYDALAKDSAAKHVVQQKQQKVNLKPLQEAIAALQKWQTQTATPELNSWTTFYKRWQKDYLPPVTTLKLWLRSPAEFALYATPPILPKAIGLLATKQYLPLAQTLEQLLLHTWTAYPDATLNAILAWLVSEQ